MSNRAYRIDELKLKNNGDETINLTHSDMKLLTLLGDKGFLGQLNDDLCGIGYLEVELAKEIVERAEEFNLPDFSKKALSEDIKWAEQNNKSEIPYYCT